MIRFKMIIDIIRGRVSLGIATDVRVVFALVYSYIVDEIFCREYHGRQINGLPAC